MEYGKLSRFARLGISTQCSGLDPASVPLVLNNTYINVNLPEGVSIEQEIVTRIGTYREEDYALDQSRSSRCSHSRGDA